MQLALYGGTFDPIHHGHLLMAREAMETLRLDRMIFIPANRSPHKSSSEPAPGSIRRDMIAAAIADEPGFALDDSELIRPGPSYTIDTVESILSAHPNAHVYCLVGADNLAELPTWRRYEDLRRLAEFVILGRGVADEKAADGVRTLGRRIDISSTEIRRRVALGQSIRYLVPEAVRAMIARHHLYQNSPHQL